jgi:hypothetical protein
VVRNPLENQLTLTQALFDAGQGDWIGNITRERSTKRSRKIFDSASAGLPAPNANPALLRTVDAPSQETNWRRVNGIESPFELN